MEDILNDVCDNLQTFVSIINNSIIKYQLL